MNIKNKDTIFAPLTIKGRCSLFVIRISGNLVNECIKKLGIKKDIKPNCVILDKIYYNKSILDNILIAYFKAPKSFTGEDILELNLHCSSYIIDKVYEILLNIDGVRLAEHGEFSKRAFLNGKIDLVEAEAICDLVDSKNELQHKQALKQLLGQTSEFFDNLRKDILEISANLEAIIDFPEDNIDPNLIKVINNKINDIKVKINNLLVCKDVSEKIKNGLNIAIIGEPNVGKSSFLNFLAKKDIAIVCDIAGTTRDIVETKLEINGIFVNLYDTAGIRESTDIIEKEGIKRAIKIAKTADLKILIVDYRNLKIDKSILNLIDKNTLILINKIDLNKNFKNIDKQIKDIFGDNKIINVSIKNSTNMDKVITYIKNYIEENITPYVDNNLTQERYKTQLSKTLKNLDDINFNLPIEIIAEKIRIAGFCLGEITGQINSEEILNAIFSKFCIGK